MWSAMRALLPSCNLKQREFGAARADGYTDAADGTVRKMPTTPGTIPRDLQSLRQSERLLALIRPGSQHLIDGKSDTGDAETEYQAVTNAVLVR